MRDDAPAQLVYVRYTDFLAADPRRTGDALELGADWRDGDVCYRACWYQQTGELTLERLAAHEPLDPDDFHRGVTGPVEVLRHVPTRAQLTALVGRWPNVAPGRPRTVACLRELVTRDGALRPLDRRSP